MLFYLIIGFGNCSPTKKFIEPDFSFPIVQKSHGGALFDLQTLPPQTCYVVLNVFAPDCPPCVVELPEIKKIYEASLKKEKKIFFIALGSTLDTLSLSTPQKDDKNISKVNEFREKYSLQYPVYFANSKILQSFGVTGFPETFIFAKDKNNTALMSFDVNFRLVRKFISSIKFREIEDLRLIKKDVAPFCW